jgi:hypothetical protein
VPRKPATGRRASLHTLALPTGDPPRASSLSCRPRGRPGHCPTTFHDDGQVQADAAAGPARPAPASSARLRLGTTTSCHGYRAGDHADPGRPRAAAARRIGALDELTRFGHSRRGNARMADAGCPDARTPTGHRTPDAWTPIPDSGHPDVWTPTPDTGHRSRGHRRRGHWTLTPDAGCC